MSEPLVKTDRKPPPAWVKNYADYLPCSVDMLDSYYTGHATTFENAPLALAQIAVQTVVDTLVKLHRNGLINATPMEEPVGG